ncbi:hypothetical protein FRC03_010286 [Tulasnella sp. 419]|nr:hypothetical protein FRC03_010286 [Tulasnella sp. 419]
MLPVELLELIFKYCDKHSLRYLLPINSLFYALAAPLLYETVALDGLALWRLVGALKTLAQNQQLASLVKQLLIDISDFHEDPKLSAVHQSTRQNLQTALSGMVNLNHLRLRATTRYFAPPRGFDYVFAAIKSSSITSFHTNVAIYENLVALIAKQHSLVQLSVTGNLPVKYIKPFLKALSSCNLDYMQARLSVLMSIAPYHGFKRLAVPGTGYSSSFEIADFADTLRTTCPRYLDVKESFFFGQWLGMLHALAKSGTVLGFLSSKLFIEEDYEVESVCSLLFMNKFDFHDRSLLHRIGISSPRACIN